MTAWLLPLVIGAANAQASASAGLDSYFKARAVLEAGLDAIGGADALRAAGAVRRRMTGDWFGSGQGRQAESFVGPTLTTPASNSHDELTSFVDYRRGRWLDERLQSAGTRDAVTVIDAGAAGRGFESVTYRREKPLLRAYGNDEITAFRVAGLRRYPEGVLLMALDRPETLQWVGVDQEQGSSQQVISFADSLGSRVSLYFDAQSHLLTKSETLRSHAVAGDSHSEVFYDDYRRVEGLTLPFHYVDRVAGVPTQEWRARAIELHATLSEGRFESPRRFARGTEDPKEPVVRKVGEALYLIRGPYNTMFAAFRDYVVVFEAPVSGAYAESALRLVRATLPGKPIRYLVSTHFHFDHVAGVRPYVAEEVPIITTTDAGPVIERVAAASHTMHPDALSRGPRAPLIEAVADRRVIDDGSNRVEIYEIGPTEHVTHMLAAFFPRDKVLFVADLWDIVSTDLVIAGADTVALATKIHELGLHVERIIPVHGAPGTRKMLQEALAVRAKYLR